MTGGLEEPAVRRADIAAAYEDDMFNWSPKSPRAAADGPGTQERTLQQKPSSIMLTSLKPEAVVF